MRRPGVFVLLVALSLVLVWAVAAHADGPGGSTEHRAGCVDGTGSEVPPNPDGSCPEGSSAATIFDNDVTCGENTDVAGFDVFVGAGGVEVCNDGGNASAPQGRVMAAGDPASQSGFVGADGDKDNSPEQAQGWLGLSSDAGTPIACGDANGNLDLSHASAEDDVMDCLPA